MRTRPALLALTAALAAVTLVGCSSGDGGDAKGSKLSYEDSPLAKFMGYADMAAQNEDPEAQAEMVEKQKKVEELTAECMQKEGFDYTPQKVDESMFSSSMASGDWDPDNREWVAQYGYGMINWPGADGEETGSETNTDPNGEYVQSLSQGEQTAYYEALYGTAFSEEPSEDGTMQEYDWKTAGCSGAAQHEVYPDQTESADLSQFDDLNTAMNDLYTPFYDGTTVTEADEKWSACMTGKGYSEFTLQSEAQNSLSDEVSALWEKISADVDPDDPNAEYPDIRKTEEGKKLGEKEIELALIDLDCREASDYANEKMRLQFAAEEAFIAEHKDELTAYKAALDAAEDKK